MSELIRVDQLQVSEKSVGRDGRVFAYLWDGRINGEGDHLWVASGALIPWSDGTFTVDVKLYHRLASPEHARTIFNMLVDELGKEEGS
jgi:hypothetical protein